MDMPSNELLEQEIAQLQEELKKKTEALQSGATAREHREALGEILADRIEQTPVPETDTPSSVAEQTPALLPEQGEDSSGVSPEVQGLVDVAFSSGIANAVQKAKSTKNAALVDEFHKLLTGQLYDELVRRGIVPASE